jgi:hypothetical protein
VYSDLEDRKLSHCRSRDTNKTLGSDDLMSSHASSTQPTDCTAHRCISERYPHSRLCDEP